MWQYKHTGLVCTYIITRPSHIYWAYHFRSVESGSVNFTLHDTIISDYELLLGSIELVCIMYTPTDRYTGRSDIGVF